MRQLTYDWCKYGFAPVIKASAKACYTQTTGYIGHKCDTHITCGAWAFHGKNSQYTLAACSVWVFQTILGI